MSDEGLDILYLHGLAMLIWFRLKSKLYSRLIEIALNDLLRSNSRSSPLRTEPVILPHSSVGRS